MFHWGLKANYLLSVSLTIFHFTNNFPTKSLVFGDFLKHKFSFTSRLPNRNNLLRQRSAKNWLSSDWVGCLSGTGCYQWKRGLVHSRECGFTQENELLSLINGFLLKMFFFIAYFSAVLFWNLIALEM